MRLGAGPPLGAWFLDSIDPLGALRQAAQTANLTENFYILAYAPRQQNFCLCPAPERLQDKTFTPTKHLKKSNAACFYTPIVLKLLSIVQM